MIEALPKASHVPFFYPFMTFLQPGILWPELAPWRPILLLSVVAGVWVLIRNRAGKPPAPNFSGQRTFLWLLVYVIVQILSVYYSGVSSMLEEFDAWFVYPVFVAISLLLIRDEKSLRQYVWGMLVGGAVVVGYGLYHVAIRPPELAGRPAGAYGLYENHNDFTFILLTLLPYAFLTARTQKRALLRVMLWLFSACCAFAVVISLSRGGAVVLALEVLVLVGVVTSGRRRAVALLAVLTIGPIIVVHQFSAREAARTNDYTVESARTSRFELWTAAARMVAKHPFLGVGSRRFSEYASDYAEISHDNLGKVTHNTFLEVASGSGLLGLGSYLLMMGGLMRRLIREARAGCDDVALRSICSATLIALSAILLRSTLDAKIFDSCIFTLVAIGIATCVLVDRSRQETPSAAARAQSRTSLQRPSSQVFPAARRLPGGQPSGGS
jgi:O-antigen ligase